MVLNVLLVLVVSFKLGEHIANVVDHKLWELSVIVFDDEAEELAVTIVDDVAYFLLERERCQLLPFELGVVFAYVKDVDFVLNFICLVHII